MPGGKLPARDVVARRRIHASPSRLEACGVIDLVMIGFPDANAAERVLAELQKRSMTFEDAAIARRNGNGRPHLKRDFTSGRSGNLQGAMWGALVALPLMHSLVGLSIGAALGPGGQARSDQLTRHRIRDDAARSIASTLQPNTSALAIVMRNVAPAKLLAELPLHLRGWVIRSSYPPEQEARLKAALSGGTGETLPAQGDAAAGNA